MCTYEILFNVPETTDPSTEHNEKDVVDTSQGKTVSVVTQAYNHLQLNTLGDFSKKIRLSS